MKITHASIMILLLLLISLVASASGLTSFSFGGKSGDWIEYQVERAFGSATDEWEKLEFLNVTGSIITVRATVYTNTWTEINETRTIDLASQDDFLMRLFRARVYIVPAGLSTNDSVYLGDEVGLKTISGETTGTYAGADRRLVYSNFTQGGSNYTFYWDKQTGVLTQGAMTSGSGFNAVFVTATNMWGAQISYWIWIIIAIVVVLGVLSSRKAIMQKLQRKPEAQHDLTKTSLPSVLRDGKVNRNV